jgi:hypothetical protein
MEHYESGNLPQANLWLRLGSGSLSAPTIVSSVSPPRLNGQSAEGVFSWNVTSQVATAAAVNQMLAEVHNTSTNNSAKINVDRLWVEVTYTP